MRGVGNVLFYGREPRTKYRNIRAAAEQCLDEVRLCNILVWMDSKVSPAWVCARECPQGSNHHTWAPQVLRILLQGVHTVHNVQSSERTRFK